MKQAVVWSLESVGILAVAFGAGLWSIALGFVALGMGAVLFGIALERET